MQRYHWPGYGIQLLGELQRQQNNAQFCDTLLQTEGISVPTHSCILAALSPYLSQKLSTSPSPPSGQKRQLQLQAVGAQTLLKLVGLLYSGELEVKGGVEQNDVLSAARQFGITDLVEGQKDGRMKEGTPQKKSSGNSRERNESRVMQDIPGSPAEKRSLVSTGTQTVKAAEKTAGSSVTHSDQVKPSNQEPASFVAQSLDFSILLQPQNITFDKQACSTSFPPIPPSSDGSTLDQSSLSVTNPMSASLLSSSVIFVSDESTSLSPQEDGTCQQPSERKTYDKMADSREDTEQPSHPKRNEMLGNCAEKKQAHANVGAKSLAKMKQMQQMMETTQISIKVKLRRRTKGDAWEVVSGHDDTLSALTCLEQDGSNLLQPATTNSPEAPLQSNTTYGAQLPLSDCFTPNTNSSLESVLLPQPPAPVEESDEQIEKLLEDIMMGLNILPNLQKDCKRSHHLQLSHDDAPASCQVPVTADSQAPSRMHATVSAAGGVYYQDFETQIGDTTTDTGVHCCFTAGTPSSCSVLPSVSPNAVLIQQQQSSLHCHSSLSPMGQKYRSSQKDMPSSKDQKGTYPEAPTTGSVTSAAFCSSGQTLHHPVCQGPPSQDDQNILTNGNEVPSSLSFFLPCMDELRLPRCLSPLEQFAPAAEHQPFVDNSTTNQSATAQPQPSLHGRPWLTEEPGSLQFPLRAIAHRADGSVSLPLDTNSCCRSKQQQKPMELNSQNRVTWTESHTVRERTVPPGHGNTAVMTSDPREKKEHLGCKQGDAAVPQRKKKEHSVYPPGAASSLSAYRDVKVSDGTKAQISLNACSVSLSSNNMLAREREMATSSSNILNKFVEKPNELSTIAESLREKDGGPRDLGTNQTRIRTRGFLKKTLETASNAHLEWSSGVNPMALRANIVNIRGVSPPRRKRGRPPKKKVEEISSESCPAVAGKKSHNVESEPLIDNSLPKMEESDRIKRSCKKRRKTRSLVEVIPLKKTISDESTGNNNDIIPAGRNPGTPKQPRMVTLKELQKLITCQRSKTRKANERQDKETGETAQDVGSKGKACGNTDEGLKESHVTVGKTPDHILNKSTDECSRWQRDEPNSCLTKESGVVTDGNRPEFSFHVLEEKVTKLAAERGQPLKDPDEAQRCDDAGASQAAQQMAVRDEGSSTSHTHTQTHLPEEDKMPFDHNLEPQTPEKTGPPLLAAVGFSKSSGCTEEEEEGEGEEEVDILLYSPDKVPQIRECKDGLDSMDGSPEEEEEEEEEEEDVTEVDVTGDEAE